MSISTSKDTEFDAVHNLNRIPACYSMRSDFDALTSPERSRSWFEFRMAVVIGHVFVLSFLALTRSTMVASPDSDQRSSQVFAMLVGVVGCLIAWQMMCHPGFGRTMRRLLCWALGVACVGLLVPFLGLTTTASSMTWTSTDHFIYVLTLSPPIVSTLVLVVLWVAQGRPGAQTPRRRTR